MKGQNPIVITNATAESVSANSDMDINKEEVSPPVTGKQRGKKQCSSFTFQLAHFIFRLTHFYFMRIKKLIESSPFSFYLFLFFYLVGQEMYALRLKSVGFPHSLLPSEETSLYFKDGEALPANLDKIGDVVRISGDLCNTLKSQTCCFDANFKTESLEEPEVAEARRSRVAAFQRMADNTIVTDINDHGMNEMILPGEEIFQIIKCQEVLNLPSFTSPSDLNIKGNIQVAIVKKKNPTDDNNGARLIFSVSHGTVTIDVQESFSLTTCCFSPCCNIGSYSSEYTLAKDMTSALMSLPLRNQVIDAIAYQSVDKKVTAATGGAKDKCFTCCKCCNCCDCCVCCDCFKCCKCECFVSDQFSAHEKHIIGQSPDEDYNITKSISGVEWTMDMEGSSETCVVIQYKSPLDNKMKSCKLVIGKDTSYSSAKQFVMAISVLRTSSADFSHEPMSYTAPAGFTTSNQNSPFLVLWNFFIDLIQ